MSSIPPSLRSLLLDDSVDPGDMYRLRFELLAREQIAPDYALTETIVYATEVRYAIGRLTDPAPSTLRNFGDLSGDSDVRLYSALSGLPSPLSIGFVGSGPYPVSALLLKQRFPTASITCIDNNIVGFLLGRAVIAKSGLSLNSLFEEGLNVDYRQYNTVVVAAMVSNKRGVVERALSTSQAHVTVRGAVDVVSDRVTIIQAAFNNAGAIATTSDRKP